MGLRAVLNKNKSASIVVTILLVAAAVALGCYLKQPGADAVELSLKAYYSDDDGKTYFVDAANKLTPFDHNGKQAYAVRVYRCPDQPAAFVGYLQRIDDKTLVAAQQALAAGKPAEDIERVIGSHREVKKPGDSKWVRSNTAEGERVAAARCNNALVVLPDNSDH
jgi:hypothetical protein